MIPKRGPPEATGITSAAPSRPPASTTSGSKTSCSRSWLASPPRVLVASAGLIPAGDRMNPAYDFHGPRCLVTCAASGHGLAVAQAFADSGRRRRARRRRRAAPPGPRRGADLRRATGRALSAATSADEDQVAALVERTVDTFGRLDFGFNNAGIQAPPTDAADEPTETFDRVNAINLRGVWACMKHERRPMRAQGSGAIVNRSSLGGLVGLLGRAAYDASKMAPRPHQERGARIRPRGIRINVICPGPVETPMVADILAKGELDVAEAMANQPIGGLGRPARSPQPCSGSAAGCDFVIGVARPVDGGYTAD